MQCFGVPKLWSIHSTPLDQKMMFGSVSEHFAKLRQVKRCKTCVWGLNALFRGTEVMKHPFYSIGPKFIFGTVLEHFANLRQVTRCETCVRSLSALFSRYQGCETSPLDTKWCLGVFRSISNHQQVTRCKTCVPSLNTLFRGIKVVKHPFYSIGPKLIFGSVSEHFANLRQVTRCKTFVRSLNALFRGTKVVKHLHWTQNDVWECFGAFR
jgi:acid stress-induced BolA-like protein IbaG/YrbA